MNRLKSATLFISLFFLAVVILSQPQISVAGIQNGLSVCTGTVLPVLFPFFIINNLWISLGYADRMSRILGPLVQAIYHVPGSAAAAMITGAIGGHPLGAQSICKAYKANRLTKEEAEHASLFCCNAGPAFILGIVGTTLFHNSSVAGIIWAIHLGTSMMLGILFRPSAKSRERFDKSIAPSKPFLTALMDAISDASAAGWRVCVLIIVFSVITAHLSYLLPSGVLSSVLIGTFELAQGFQEIKKLCLTQETAFVLSAGLLGWGGFCVNIQSSAFFFDVGLSASRYWMGKALHAALSIGVACIIAPLLPLQRPCMANTYSPPISAICLLSSMTLLLILKTSSGKRERLRI